MPFSYTRKQKVELLKKLVEYVNQKTNPMIAEFCYINSIDDQTLKAWAQKEKMRVKDENSIKYDFALALKKSTLKQQTYLAQLSIEKGQNPGGPIFLLKALHGYKDQEPAPAAQTNISVNVDKLLKAAPEALETGIQDLLQTTKIDNIRKRKSNQKN